MSRHIDSAIMALEQAERWISNRAHSSDDYKLAKYMRDVTKLAREELAALSSAPNEKIVYLGDEPDHEHLECYCNANNAPCKWCQTHCHECSEYLEECVCEEPQ